MAASLDNGRPRNMLIAMRCLLALLSVAVVASCAAPDDTPAQPFEGARLAGRLRAANLLRAESCSPNATEIAKEVRVSGLPPANYTAGAANAFHAGFAEWYMASNTPQPSPQACQVLRADPDYAALFKPSETAATKPAARRASRPAKSNQPAYCATGYLKAKIDSDWAIARDAIKQDCQPGDSLILPAFASGLIASVCDTNKPISRISEDVVCTLGPIRELRAPS